MAGQEVDTYLDAELPGDEDDASESGTSAGQGDSHGAPLEHVRAQIAQFFNGLPLPKVAVIAAVGLALGFLAGRATAPETVRAVPMTAQVATTASHGSTAPSGEGTSLNLNDPKSWQQGTSTIPPATTAPTSVPATYPSGVAAGYSTQMPLEFIRSACLNREAGHDVLGPTQCLRSWELTSAALKSSYWHPLASDPEQTIVPPQWR